MRNTKKTKQQSPDGFLCPGYTEPGVHHLTEIEAGMARAILVYPQEQDYVLESFKLFDEFLTILEPLDLHVTMSKLYFKMLALTKEHGWLFENLQEQIHFSDLIEFLAKLAVEQRISMNNENMALRKLKQEPGKN